ncbi:phosphonate ABC transporter, permease protein PhnE [Paenibacillus sp. SYP-B3998]|uniref:Phosphonate ABC transporter, permease protein PhnE n=1 Tax=Paenibacillus sp. SYP-B3998 TaxID=2678564 RepID=A0A6G4A2H2_9BACL|nr:phosphonate ABC transporter, permease protein PhnE [Paenibacillus sp. SYP-B3998]NEW08134.1 phosphonate ABC transporter, permease protein PhnE [Paenibacillus sp. SYP-B3998]
MKGAPLKRPDRTKFYLNMTIVVLLLAWSAYKTDASLINLITNSDQMFQIVWEMLPPNLSYMSTIWEPILETIQMAIIGTTIGAILAIPIAFFASQNVSKYPVLYYPARFILNLFRAIPELLYATLFVTIFGIGPLAGVLALVVFSFGIVSKLLYESIEAIDPGPLEAMTAVGANKLQWIHYGVIPQVTSAFISYFLYTFEVNIRASAILGMVGAGGIGFLLERSLNQFRYDNTAMIVLVTFIVVMIIDYVSNKIREKWL